jgi:putative sugar O-methyltransferase
MKLKEYLIQNLQYCYSRLCERRSENPFNDIIINQNDIDTLKNLEEAEYNLMEEGLVHSTWFDFHKMMENYFISDTKEFLRKPAFKNAVSVTSLPFFSHELRLYLKYINKWYSKSSLKKLLYSSTAGKPYLVSCKYHTTFVRIQHLYQVGLYKFLSGIDLLNINGTIVDFGAGYGDMANLIYSNNSFKPTLILIDLPIMGFIQYSYLKTMHNGNIFLLSTLDNSVTDHAINIVPLHLISKITNKIDMFLATYSLTETNHKVVNFLQSNNVLESNRFFIAYQSKNIAFPDGPIIAERLKSDLGLKSFTNYLENGNFLYR